MKKIIKLTESDLTNIIKRVIIEQRSDYAMDAQANAIARASGIRSQEDYNTVNRITKKAMDVTMGNIDKHTAMTLLQIGTAFIPFVGPFISMGIGLADAAIYYNEGDKKTAGLVGMFAIIPGIGGLSSKLGISKWGAKALGEIGKKIGMGAKLTSSEIQVANRIAQNRQLLQAEISKLGKLGKSPSLAKQGVKSQLKRKVITKNVGNFAGTVAGYGATGSVYGKTYDNLQKNTPKHKAESKGLNWELVKQSFGSSGSEEDNKLLNAALDKGWKPGQVVPQGLQTQLYKTEYTNDVNRIKGLQSLIANAKTK
jgi:hypothetical protein